MNQFYLDYALVEGGEVAVYDQELRSRFDWLREPDPWCRGDCRLMTLAFVYAHRTPSNARPARATFWGPPPAHAPGIRPNAASCASPAASCSALRLSR